MSRFLNLLGGAAFVLARAGFAAACIAMVLMMLHICADVIGRAFLNAPIAGTLEIVSSYYMVAICFLPLGLLELHNDQIFVEVFTRGLRRGVQIVMDVAANAGTAIVFGLIAISSGLYAWSQMQHGEFLDVVFYDLPIWPSRFVVAAGFALASLGAVLAGITLIKTLRAPR